MAKMILCRINYMRIDAAAVSEFLHVDEASVIAVEGKKLVVSAAFNDASLMEHAYKVGVADCGKSVCDYECRAVLHEPVKSLLHYLFALGVEC